MRLDAPTGRAGQGEDVGEVLLALGVVRRHLREALTQHDRVEGVDARVDLADVERVRELRVPGLAGGESVLVLDDAGDGTGFVAQDAAVAGRVLDLRGQHGDGVAARLVRARQVDEGLRREQRHVAVGDEDGAAQVGRQDVEGALGGAAGALDLVLIGDRRARLELLDVRGDDVALVTHDDREMLRLRAACRVDGVAEQAAATDRVQHLRDVGLHASALACGEDDDGCGTGCAHASDSLRIDDRWSGPPRRPTRCGRRGI